MSEVTIESPGPFIIPKSPGILDQSLCLEAKRAIRKYLFMGEQVGEPTLLITYGNVFPFVAAWKASADRVAKKGLDLRISHVLPFGHPLFTDIKHMEERAAFYMETLESVKDELPEEQRRVILGYVVNPLFRGVRYKIYFDEESGAIDAASDYCTPMRIANQLGYAVNVYRELVGTSVFSRWGKLGDAYTDVIADAVESALGPAEVYQRSYQEDIKPLLKNAKAVTHAAVHTAVAVVKAASKSSMLGIASLVILGGGIYMWTRKR